MSGKTVINIESLQLARLVLNQFNLLNLADIELREDGKPLLVTPEMIEEWKFIGLGNSAFVEVRFWEGSDILDANEASK